MMAKDEAAEPMTTLSARFTEVELQALKRAAESKKWSLSQLIRAGAHEKAVNILNASSTAAFPVRRMLGQVAEQLYRPRVMMRHYNTGAEAEFDETEFNPEEWVLVSTSLSLETCGRLSEAMRLLGSELGAMFTDEVIRAAVDDVKERLLDPATSLAEIPDVPAEKPAETSAAPTKKKLGRGRKG